MDNTQDISELARELSDLELALLLCLSGQEHCLIEATRGDINDVAAELALICSHTYGLVYKVVEFSDTTSLEEFCDQICASPRKEPGGAVEYSTVDVVIAKNFDCASQDIQLQALDLMRSKKLATGNDVIEAAPRFLFVSVVQRDPGQVRPKLNAHLNDNLLISHFHDSEDGYVYLEDDDWQSDGQASLSSVIHRTGSREHNRHPSIGHELLDGLNGASRAVKATAELIRYQQDIVVFLRLSRAVGGGISARSNIQFAKLAKLLAVIHGIDYLTPSIVALAAKKVFRHRIVVARPEDDRSLQYGSDLRAVAKVLEYATPDTILESVLTLEAPL
ncbi:hypothetical protein ASPSYDRAFT_143794 [Aspergillus sydowii CBS 593.65]|uniref:magnesium chelatase n=1 Tax=Aspergillus sydowii CBS 593.65 TaxID=1036612 RepID=A0A1L9TR04_9EURO|nr:uncharacterized protein ASPSYDRAFT_143794 [Aspergillus sydowii CBS 593.65]OJJ61805.1 hypothetical protein ASPSYDRAFT_143794 [Aspergillus sydowii CBS 593.65]